MYLSQKCRMLQTESEVWSHLPLLNKTLQAHSSYFNRNLRAREFHVRAKKFAMQILKLVTQIIYYVSCVFHASQYMSTNFHVNFANMAARLVVDFCSDP